MEMLRRINACKFCMAAWSPGCLHTCQPLKYFSWTLGTVFRDFQEFSGTAAGGSAMETSTRLRHFISTMYCTVRFRVFSQPHSHARVGVRVWLCETSSSIHACTYYVFDFVLDPVPGPGPCAGRKNRKRPGCTRDGYASIIIITNRPNSIPGFRGLSEIP